MTSRLEKLQWYMPAVAVIVVIASCIIISAPLIWMATCVVIAALAFYFIGDFMRYYLTTRVFPPEEKPLIDEEDDMQVAFDDSGQVVQANHTDQSDSGESTDEVESGQAVILEKNDDNRESGLFEEEPFVDGMLEEELLEEENLEDAFMDSQ